MGSGPCDWARSGLAWRIRRRRRLGGVLAALALVVAGCGRGESRPNILWIVWDTVRADRMSLYGHPRETTPHLERWARSARVFDATAVSCWTLPSHTSMFTGLFPGEHGVNALGDRLEDRFDTIAEILGEEGYETWLFSANPFVSRNLNLTQGFATEEHPTDAALVERARAMVLAKIDPENRATSLRGRLRKRKNSAWFIKAVGELANERFFDFLDRRAPERPFFAFINYMEAHRERVPSRRFLERTLEPEALAEAYAFEQSQRRFQRVSLGLEEPFSKDQRELIGAIYDAALLELDEHLDHLLAQLRDRRLSADTVVILTSDHGEHLGEDNSYLHQYSLREAVLSVPLVIWAPGRLAPGRETVAVTNVDLFPTILDLAGVRRPRPPDLYSLLRPPAERPLVAEYLEAYEPLLRRFERTNPDWDSAPYRRSIRALRLGPHQLLWSSGEAPELYDLTKRPEERTNLTNRFPQRAAELAALLEAWLEARRPSGPVGGPESVLTEQEKEQLRSLGYL